MKRPKASEGQIPGGVIVAGVTPRRAREYSIDLAATLELVDFLGDSGVDGVALLGSTGEFVHFALDDRRNMVKFAAKRSRVPLLVNVSHSTLDGAVDLARDAAEDGVSGVLIMPPYYFRYSQDAVRSFFLEFAKAVERATPIYLYNIPQFTNEIEISTALDLLSTGLFTGIKDSSGSLDYCNEILGHATSSPITLMIGSDRIYCQARSSGADGVVSGVACAVPELLVAMDRSIQAGETERASSLDIRLQEFISWIEHFPAPVGVKEAVRLRKYNMGAWAVPLGADADRKLAAFGEWFQGWLPKVLRECGR